MPISEIVNGAANLKKISEIQALEVFASAGLKPLEEFTGARNKWRCACQKCGHTFSPYFYSVKAGSSCPACARTKQADQQRAAGLRAALLTCEENNYALESEYKNAKHPVNLRCLICNRSLTSTINSLKQGQVKCDCRKTARQKLSDFYPELFAEIDWESVPGVPKDQIGTGTRLIIGWKCKSKNHSFRTSPANRIASHGECLVCRGVLPERGVNDLQSRYPTLSSEFVRDPENGLTPSDVFPGSNRKFFWKCRKKESHPEYLNSPWARIRGEGCPYCANKRILPGDNDLASQYPNLLAEWDFEKNGKLSPYQVAPGSQKKAFWICKNNHTWQATIASRSKGAGCEKCWWFQPGRNDLATLGSEILIREWSTELNKKTPAEVSASSSDKYWWVCEACKEPFQAKPANRHFNGTGCPSCAPTGYSSKKPSTLYFLQHNDLLARKIGKTNTFTTHDRLQGFRRRGWVVIHQWDFPTGHIVDFAEKAAISWIRNEKLLPQYLTKEDMRGMAGETETFSLESTTNNEVIQQVNLLISLWETSETHGSK